MISKPEVLVQTGNARKTSDFMAYFKKFRLYFMISKYLLSFD